MKKHLLIILILPLALTGCVWFGQQTQTNESVDANQNVNAEQEDIDTSDWQTYRNEEYGFEFKYPQSWIVEVSDGEHNFADSFSLSGDDSRMTILPRGEFDYGISSGERETSQELLGGKEVLLTRWYLDEGKALLFYQFTEKIPGWVDCSESLKNCNRIEVSVNDSEDLKIFQKLLSTFIFF